MKSYVEYKDLLDDALLSYLPKMDERTSPLKEAMEYSLSAGGKRLRPVLLLASCDMVGGDVQKALPYACAIEFIHTYSLIHDDLPAMDDDDLRRGKPTNHKVYGEGQAILAGDGLLNSAFQTMIEDIEWSLGNNSEASNKISAMNVICSAAGVQGMIGGQAADLSSENASVSEDMLNFIHQNKTGALIKTSVYAGLILGNANLAIQSKMLPYSEKLGLAFQIADDILDVIGSAESIGKNPGQDQEHNKSTFVSVYGLDKAKSKLMDVTEEAIGSLDGLDERADFFRELIKELSERALV